MSASFFKFLLIGGLGFVIDTGLTLGLVAIGISPLAARPPAILVAMLFTWLANRQHTFGVDRKTNIAEVVRYASVAGVAALVNYLIYSVLVTFSLPPFIAIVIATILVAAFSYFGYKHFAFDIPGKT